MPAKTVYDIIGQRAPLNKPIVGKNAFLHESGIHQHGVLANKHGAYEILTPESVGIRTRIIWCWASTLAATRLRAI